MKRRRFFRRRSRKVKRDVLNFSLCDYATFLDLSQPDPAGVQPLGSCANPFISMTPLILGGQAGVSGGEGLTGHANALFASDQAERGAVMGPFKFKYILSDGGYLNSDGPDNTTGVTHIVYSAIVKQEYDLDQYRKDGTLGVTKLPNIVGAFIPILGAANSATTGQPIGDINATDVLWRDIAWLASRPLDSSLLQGVPIDIQPDFQWYNKGQTPPWNYIRVKRRLNENEGLFWVHNVVSGLPRYNVENQSFFQGEFVTFLYGYAAAKLR